MASHHSTNRHSTQPIYNLYTKETAQKSQDYNKTILIMFRFLRRQHKTLDVITLFHKPSLPASSRVLALLKQANAAAAANATIDQASETSPNQRCEFELNVTEEPPTPDQLKNILDYVGADVGGDVGKARGGAAMAKPGDLVQGAQDRLDALRRLKEDGGRFVRPVAKISELSSLPKIVDWNNGTAVIGENKSEILKLVREIPPDVSPQ
ncbi:uncharacterized protein PADG_04646 [Paracoccidioides brasiliensis Pb18]|uniref:Uncharacterized protein n=1 Tax=Paracoccidioides brasiliensis (strain Pb18) TaxID=502780 RepID=C1GCC4_PARBD|nr:uncharacterized protein PADG_04646 [Paracoccidioides brasiliensis Pb18]EEH48567.2 hypothetical protein PADG_04646 [Paracoccidioides brasiliensis Pb18]